VQFEAVLKKEPNRFKAFAGAAASSARSGDINKAKSYLEKLLKLAGDATSDRPAVTAARQFLATR
jgi:hypothetical protein